MPHPDAHAPGVFTHGVASGDVTADRVVLWTRARPPGDDRPLPVRWQLAADGEEMATGTVVAEPEHDFACHVTVSGLRSSTAYHYSFEALGERVEGRTTTLPERADHLRVAVACCSRWGWPGFDHYGAIADDDPDFVLHLGDYIYEIGEIPPDGPPTEPAHECQTLDDYRVRYAQHRRHPGLQRLHASFPMIAVWDDHEVVDNAPDDESRERRAAGQRAWREWLPTDRDTPSLDRSLAVGGLLDLVLVDARFRGRGPSDTDGPAAAPDDGELLVPAQWNRLADVAGRSSAPWFVVANQVQVSPLTLTYAPRVAWPPWRRVVNPDQWDGFPDARRRLVELLDGVAGTPVVLSGDLHAAWSRDLLDGDRVVAHEFTAPSISGTTFAAAVRQQTCLPRRLLSWIIRRLNPGIDLLELDRHGYLLIDVAPERLTTTFVFSDGERVERVLQRPGRGHR